MSELRNLKAGETVRVTGGPFMGDTGPFSPSITSADGSVCWC